IIFFVFFFFFFFQAEDGIRDLIVTGVQTCALPISLPALAKSSSTGPATSAGRAEKAMSGSSRACGFGSVTTSSATELGKFASFLDPIEDAYSLPTLLSDAATALTSNHGWWARSWTNFWPIIPVAPRTATF